MHEIQIGNELSIPNNFPHAPYPRKKPIPNSDYIKTKKKAYIARHLSVALIDI